MKLTERVKGKLSRHRRRKKMVLSRPRIQVELENGMVTLKNGRSVRYEDINDIRVNVHYDSKADIVCDVEVYYSCSCPHGDCGMMEVMATYPEDDLPVALRCMKQLRFRAGLSVSMRWME